MALLKQQSGVTDDQHRGTSLLLLFKEETTANAVVTWRKYSLCCRTQLGARVFNGFGVRLVDRRGIVSRHSQSKGLVRRRTDTAESQRRSKDGTTTGSA